MPYKGYRSTYDFTKFKAILAFGNAIENGIITKYMVNHEQKKLVKLIKTIKSKTRPWNHEKNMKKRKRRHTK